MGFVKHVVSSIFKPVTKLLGVSSAPQSVEVQTPASSAAPANSSADMAGNEVNTAKKKRRGKRSLIVNSTPTNGGGSTGINI